MPRHDVEQLDGGKLNVKQILFICFCLAAFYCKVKMKNELQKACSHLSA